MQHLSMRPTYMSKPLRKCKQRAFWRAEHARHKDRNDSKPWAVCLRETVFGAAGLGSSDGKLSLLLLLCLALQPLSKQVHLVARHGPPSEKALSVRR